MVYENTDQKGDRIRVERLRLGLSQTEFASLMNKQKMAVFRYEKGERTMNHEDFEALHRAGVDIWFLITGERSGVVPLSAEQQELLKLFYQVELSQRDTLLKLVRNFAESFPLK